MKKPTISRAFIGDRGGGKKRRKKRRRRRRKKRRRRKRGKMKCVYRWRKRKSWADRGPGDRLCG